MLSSPVILNMENAMVTKVINEHKSNSRLTIFPEDCLRLSFKIIFAEDSRTVSEKNPNWSDTLQKWIVPMVISEH